jgi:hypothetical protein
MVDLADPPGRQKRDRDGASRRRQVRRFDETQEPTIVAADPRNDRRSSCPVPQAVLGGFEHAHGALELELIGVGHVDLDQEVRHDDMVDRPAAGGHREEHRVST